MRGYWAVWTTAWQMIIGNKVGGERLRALPGFLILMTRVLLGGLRRRVMSRATLDLAPYRRLSR